MSIRVRIQNTGIAETFRKSIIPLENSSGFFCKECNFKLSYHMINGHISSKLHKKRVIANAEKNQHTDTRLDSGLDLTPHTSQMTRESDERRSRQSVHNRLSFHPPSSSTTNKRRNSSRSRSPYSSRSRSPYSSRSRSPYSSRTDEQVEHLYPPTHKRPYSPNRELSYSPLEHRTNTLQCHSLRPEEDWRMQPKIEPHNTESSGLTGNLSNIIANIPLDKILDASKYCKVEGCPEYFAVADTHRFCARHDQCVKEGGVFSPDACRDCREWLYVTQKKRHSELDVSVRPMDKMLHNRSLRYDHNSQHHPLHSSLSPTHDNRQGTSLPYHSRNPSPPYRVVRTPSPEQNRHRTLSSHGRHTASPQAYGRHTASPQAYGRCTPPQAYGRCTPPQAYGRRIPSPQAYDRRIPSPQAYDRRIPSPQAYDRRIPSPQAYDRRIPSPQAYDRRIPSPQAYDRRIPSPQAYDRRIPSPQAYDRRIPSPQAYDRRIPSPQAYDRRIPSPQAYDRRIPSPQAYDRRIPSPQAYDRRIPSPQAYDRRIPSPQAYDRRIPSPQAYRQHSPSSRQRTLSPLSSHTQSPHIQRTLSPYRRYSPSSHQRTQSPYSRHTQSPHRQFTSSSHNGGHTSSHIQHTQSPGQVPYVQSQAYNTPTSVQQTQSPGQVPYVQSPAYNTSSSVQQTQSPGQVPYVQSPAYNTSSSVQQTQSPGQVPYVQSSAYINTPTSVQQTPSSVPVPVPYVQSPVYSTPTSVGAAMMPQQPHQVSAQNYIDPGTSLYATMPPYSTAGMMQTGALNPVVSPAALPVPPKLPTVTGIPPGFIPPPPPAYLRSAQNSQIPPVQSGIIPPQTTQTETTGPNINLYVGNIPRNMGFGLLKELLRACGTMVSWFRVHSAGRAQSIGFCKYSNPEAALRAIRLLNKLKINNKELVVRPDAKDQTKHILDKYEKNYLTSTDMLAKEKKVLEEIQRIVKRRTDSNNVHHSEGEQKQFVTKEIEKFRSNTTDSAKVRSRSASRSPSPPPAPSIKCRDINSVAGHPILPKEELLKMLRDEGEDIDLDKLESLMEST